MDYGTFFFANIVSVTVFALTVGLLAWHNRKVVGMRWFAGSIALVLAKLILQGLEGKVSVALSGMVANELYTVSFVMQGLGLRWFVLRTPMRHKWPLLAVAISLVVYTAMFLGRIKYGGNFTNIPSIMVCGASAWMLLRRGRAPVSRVSAAILSVETLVMAYRAVLTNLRYIRPWETVHAETDPRWLYSLAAMGLLTTCMVMCYLWFLVTELGKELARQARTDSLTGALNRRAMEEAASRETARCIRHRRPLCMIVLDVDHFKQINDTRGHAAGDRVLQRLVDEVKAMLRKNDLIARTGGEEFTILLPDTDATECIVAAERVRKVIEALEVPFEDRPIRFTVSAGIAQLDSSNGDWEGMMRRADSAMYAAKGHGRNAVCPDDSCARPLLNADLTTAG
jgi:diguanylate cyclase (GGDEF)-like protein